MLGAATAFEVACMARLYILVGTPDGAASSRWESLSICYEFVPVELVLGNGIGHIVFGPDVG